MLNNGITGLGFWSFKCKDCFESNTNFVAKSIQYSFYGWQLCYDTLRIWDTQMRAAPEEMPEYKLEGEPWFYRKEK